MNSYNDAKGCHKTRGQTTFKFIDKKIQKGIIPFCLLRCFLHLGIFALLGLALLLLAILPR